MGDSRGAPGQLITEFAVVLQAMNGRYMPLLDAISRQAGNSRA
jgi:hypothetical protein